MFEFSTPELPRVCQTYLRSLELIKAEINTLRVFGAKSYLEKLSGFYFYMVLINFV